MPRYDEQIVTKADAIDHHKTEYVSTHNHSNCELCDQIERELAAAPPFGCEPKAVDETA